MRFHVGLFLLTLSGCSYETSFVVCNASNEDLIVAYRTKDAMNTYGFFCSEPAVHAFTLDDGKVELDNAPLTIPYTTGDYVVISIAPGTAVITGSEVNHPVEESYATVDRVLLIQHGDTTVVRGEMLNSFAQNLGQYTGIVVK